jgi:hypothetical protein
MLIFHGFPERASAEAFAERVLDQYPDRSVRVYDSQDEANAADPFPWELQTPIVHVSRTEDEDKAEETAIEDLAVDFGGVFAGT